MTNDRNEFARLNDDRDTELYEHYKPLNPSLRAALLHARRSERRTPAEPSGGDAAMD